MNSQAKSCTSDVFFTSQSNKYKNATLSICLFFWGMDYLDEFSGKHSLFFIFQCAYGGDAVVAGLGMSCP